MDTEIFKQISIRGRFAYGLTCLEKLIVFYGINNTILNSTIKKFWEFTNIEKLGELEDYFCNIDPFCILTDYPKLKEQPERKHEFGYDDLTLNEMEQVFELYKDLPLNIRDILTHLVTIANSNISAGCGEFSILTFEPTLKIANIISEYSLIDAPKPTDFLFSDFRQNHGWGDRFEKNNSHQ